MILRFINEDDSNNAIFNYKPNNKSEYNYGEEITLSNKNKYRINHERIYIEKTVDVFDNNIVTANDELTYKIIVKNNSTNDYTDDIIVTEELSPYVTLINNGGGTESGNKITWNLGKLKSNDEITITYTVRVKSEYNGRTTEGQTILSKGTVGEIQNRTVKNKIDKVLTKDQENEIVNVYKEKVKQEYTGKTLINEVYKEVLGKDLKLDSFEIEDLIIVKDRANNSDSAMWLNTNNVLRSSILNNYWSSLCMEPNKDGTGIDYYDLRIYKNFEIRRADRIYSENFRIGDILIYKNENDVIYSYNKDGKLESTPVTNENGEYAYIYIKDENGEGFVGVNLGADKERGTADDRNEFNYKYYSNDYLKLYSKELNADYDETIQVLKDSNYQTLLAKDYYVILRPISITYENYSVGDKKYDRLIDAYQAIKDNSGEIRVLKDNIDYSELVIESGKNITIDTNGKIITKVGGSIKNNGTLTIKGNGSICTSSISEISYLITNTGNLTIEEATLTVKNDVGTSNWYTIFSTGGTVNINSGKVEENGIQDATNNGRAIGLKKGSILNIRGGEIVSNTGYAITSIASNSGTTGKEINIEGGKIRGLNGIIIYADGNYEAKTKIQMTGGKIETTKQAIETKEGTECEVVIEEGKISSNEIAIKYNGVGKLEIGKNDKTVSTINPEIKGKTIAIKAQNGFDFYDGILKGGEKPYDGKINNIPEEYELEETNESELKTLKLKIKTLTTIRGDVDGDGELTQTDLFQAKRYVVGKVEFTEEQITRADMNGDKKITATDLLQMKIAYLKTT